jgi:hypothetical protein
VWKMKLRMRLAPPQYRRAEQALVWSDYAMKYAEAAGVDNFRPRILANREPPQCAGTVPSAEHDTQSAN